MEPRPPYLGLSLPACERLLLGLDPLDLDVGRVGPAIPVFLVDEDPNDPAV